MQELTSDSSDVNISAWGQTVFPISKMKKVLDGGNLATIDGDTIIFNYTGIVRMDAYFRLTKASHSSDTTVYVLPFLRGSYDDRISPFVYNGVNGDTCSISHYFNVTKGDSFYISVGSNGALSNGCFPDTNQTICLTAIK